MLYLKRKQKPNSRALFSQIKKGDTQAGEGAAIRTLHKKSHKRGREHRLYHKKGGIGFKNSKLFALIISYCNYAPVKH